MAGAIFLGGAQLERLGGALRDHLPAEGGLQQLDLGEAQAGEAAVGGMFDLTVLAIRGADEADGVTPVVLDFEVEAGRVAFDGYYIVSDRWTIQLKYTKCMATNEIINRCGLSLDAASGLNGQKKMRYKTPKAFITQALPTSAAFWYQ